MSMKSPAAKPNPATTAPTLPTLASALLQPRMAGLDFLRAVAVLLVLLDHSGLGAIGPVQVFDGGLGVEVFFVLSGFLITWLLLGETAARGRIDLAAFYWRRATRLMPAMGVYLLVGALLILVQGKPLPWKPIAASVLYVMNYYQALTGAESHYLSHCWSLAVEEQFYLLWPVLLIVLQRSGWSLQRSLTVLILSLWTLKVGLVLGLGVSDDYLYRALETRSDQLFMGCLLAVVLKSGPRGHALFDTLARHRWVLGGVVAAMLASTTLLHGTVASKYLLGYAAEPLLIALLLPLVLIEAHRGGWLARGLNAPVMVLIGQVSYGVYLYHPFIIHPIRNAVTRATGSAPLGVGLSLVVVVAVAWASFRWIEEPLRSRLTRQTRTLRPSHVAPTMPEGVGVA
ncbi:acyltransferase family protein [Sphaerotilus sp.]|uniref:acyltransferase family protein n=1 Tax=Sphaerotilus sp. TaxID=2093942 RepID=UPI0025E77F54|nr:acyltransferase [Sphaerotilus sp.]